MSNPEEEARVSSGTSSSYDSNPELPTMIQINTSSPMCSSLNRSKVVEMLNDFHVREQYFKELTDFYSKQDNNLMDLVQFDNDDENENDFLSKLIANRSERFSKNNLLKRPEFSLLSLQIKALCEVQKEISEKIDLSNFVYK